jgi:hypothetical protein
MSEHHDMVKNTLDIVSVGTAFLSFLNMLSPLFGLVAMIWTLMRIVEMVTGKPFAELIRGKKGVKNGD